MSNFHESSSDFVHLCEVFPIVVSVQVVADLNIELSEVGLALPHGNGAFQHVTCCYVHVVVRVKNDILPVSIFLIGRGAQSNRILKIREDSVEPGNYSMDLVVSFDGELVLACEFHVFLLHLDEVQVQDHASIGVNHIGLDHIDQGLLHSGS